MVRVIALMTLVLTHTATSLAESQQPEGALRVLMTVGGVGYNTSIVRMLKSNPRIELTVRDVDDDSVVFTPAALAGIDAVLMYHRDNSAEADEREALLEYVSNGGGVVVLHHAIANYPDWQAWWRDHVGGLYVLPGSEGQLPSRYFPDFKGVARPSSDHPITRRLGDFWRYDDESYSQLWISDDVDALLTTTAFGSDSRIAWIGPSHSNRVVFVQPGHKGSLLTDPKYLVLVEDALRWTARATD